MCGIFLALISKANNENNIKNFDINDINFELLKKRGPNSFEIREIHLDNYICYFAASVLSLRGNNVVKQPINDDINRNYLLWNGEIFASSIINVNNDANDNDGIKLYQHLSNTNNEQEILDIIATIKGPFAFIYFDRKKNLIFFGRDRIGRRSLLINSTNNTLMLTSVRVFSNSCDNRSLFEFNELKSNGIYKLNLNNQFENLIEFIEWIPLSCEKQESFNQNLKLIDSISLFNESLNQIQRTQDELEQIREELLLILKQSILRRIKPLPNQCKNCYLLSQTSNNSNNKFSEFKCDHAKIAILFSGGLDSAVIAALVDQCLPENEPVDLMNIAFEQSNNNKSTSHNSFMVPDRISGLECLKELNPKRKWNFIEINITHDELKDLRAKLIKNLIYPLDTVLDDSIGCALWFVSRGIGYLNGSLYQSGAEILLLGIGADEQLAGYARHRTRFRAEGWLGLINELKMEMKRISERNLGRDDRVISDHGKESRLPYLDEDFIDYVNKQQIFDKVNFDLPKGLGEKYLLRCCASEKLGLHYASKLAKRAIQFGSRVAKLENSKEKASEKCNRLLDDE